MYGDSFLLDIPLMYSSRVGNHLALFFRTASSEWPVRDRPIGGWPIKLQLRPQQWSFQEVAQQQAGLASVLSLAAWLPLVLPARWAENSMLCSLAPKYPKIPARSGAHAWHSVLDWYEILVSFIPVFHRSVPYTHRILGSI